MVLKWWVKEKATKPHVSVITLNIMVKSGRGMVNSNGLVYSCLTVALVSYVVWIGLIDLLC